MISLHNSTHSSQMKTVGPAISLRTSCCDFPQKLQNRVLFESEPVNFVLLPSLCPAHGHIFSGHICPVWACSPAIPMPATGNFFPRTAYDRQSVVHGKSLSVRVDLGWPRLFQQRN